MKSRIILRTVSNLSFAGEVTNNKLDNDEKGILLKTSPNSNIKIWCPVEEIKSIIMPTGKILEGDELRNEFGF